MPGSEPAVLHTCVYVLSRVWLFATPGTVARQVPLSMGFPRREYWSGLPSPPGDLPGPEMEPASPGSPALAGRFFTAEPFGKFFTYTDSFHFTTTLFYRCGHWGLEFKPFFSKSHSWSAGEIESESKFFFLFFFNPSFSDCNYQVGFFSPAILYCLWFIIKEKKNEIIAFLGLKFPEGFLPHDNWCLS